MRKSTQEESVYFVSDMGYKYELRWAPKRKEYEAHLGLGGGWFDLRLGGPKDSLKRYILDNEKHILSTKVDDERRRML